MDAVKRERLRKFVDAITIHTALFGVTFVEIERDSQGVTLSILEEEPQDGYNN